MRAGGWRLEGASEVSTNGGGDGDGECECGPEPEPEPEPEGASEVSAVKVVSAGRMERAK